MKKFCFFKCGPFFFAKPSRYWRRFVTASHFIFCGKAAEKGLCAAAEKNTTYLFLTYFFYCFLLLPPSPPSVAVPPPPPTNPQASQIDNLQATSSPFFPAPVPPPPSSGGEDPISIIRRGRKRKENGVKTGDRPSDRRIWMDGRRGMGRAVGRSLLQKICTALP